MRQQVTLRTSENETYIGKLIGAPLEASGELVFTTAMVGYGEALTDPSYFGQILVFTYPLIGNYGVPELPKDFAASTSLGFESNKVHASAVIVACDSARAFHWSSQQSLDQWLFNEGVPGIVALDTRHLVHRIRDSNNLMARIQPSRSSGTRNLGQFDTGKAESYFDSAQHQILNEVSTSSRRIIGSGRKRIAIIDCGVKWNIIRQLVALGCEIELLPWDTDPISIDCSAWVISNGPGNPLQNTKIIENIKKLYTQNSPILGICLGHQMMCIAAGFRTERMAFGHRSHNQPVYQVGERKGYITSQNHGFNVMDKPEDDNWRVWFRNVNDDSIEGIKHTSLPFSSVQFHPESAGGPKDTGWIIEKFVSEVN